jgi:hypothetical protein
VTLKEDVMRKRLLLATVAGLACVGLAGLLVEWVIDARSGITRANYGRIQQGMPRHEVERLLGGPPLPVPDPVYGDEDYYQARVHLAITYLEETGQEVRRSYWDWLTLPDYEVWADNRLAIGVHFGDDGTVTWKGITAIQEVTLLSRLRRLLPW